MTEIRFPTPVRTDIFYRDLFLPRFLNNKIIIPYIFIYFYKAVLFVGILNNYEKVGFLFNATNMAYGNSTDSI